MNAFSNSNFLCLACRSYGHQTAQCTPRLSAGGQNCYMPKSDPYAEEEWLDDLKTRVDSLCERCERYGILDKFRISEIEDYAQHKEALRNSSGISDDSLWALKKTYMPLGPFRSIILYGNCPLCRLLFRAFPANGEEINTESPYYLRPFPAFERQQSFSKKVTEAEKAQYAVYFAIENEMNVIGHISKFMGDDTDEEMVWRVSGGFGLSSKNPAPPRMALNVRRMNATVDFALLRNWIKRCESSHGVCCRRKWAEELLSSRMIDVSTRTIVSCPLNCRYLTLSYVWGDVEPGEKALENRQLPQTIEDAITLTQELGFNYLWVDALCVDQQSTPEQAQQLAMMGVIYQTSVATIMALSGDNSDYGLPGVSRKSARVCQGIEVIDGMELLTISPRLEQEEAESIYFTRAWTMQESMLTYRRLIFTNNQVFFLCNTAWFSETVDDSLDPANYLESYSVEDKTAMLFHNPVKYVTDYPLEERVKMGREDYVHCVQNYTRRRLTKDSDSLNAFLGIQRYLRGSFFPNDLIWGLPLRDFPQALRWFHPRYIKPRRRPKFPSWSWTGWDGEATLSQPVDILEEYRPRHEASTDMTVQFVSIDDQILTVKANVVTLEIRTEPFSDAYVPGTDDLLGSVRERNFIHSNTLPSGTYEFLVVERLRYKPAVDRPFRSDIFMLLLDFDGDVAVRRTKVRMFLSAGVDFAKAMPQLRQIQLK